MRRITLTAVLILGLFTTVAAAAGPVVEIEEISIDVGQALQGQSVEATYQITNSGDATLEIKKVSPG